MANEIRKTLDYAFGTLSADLAQGATSATSAEFVDQISTGLTTSIYTPITLHDPVNHQYEIVWITAHTTSSDTVTIVRAREGSTDRAWSASTLWVAAPTARDGMKSVGTRGSLPSDAHLGARWSVSGDLVVAEKYASGWFVPGEWTAYTPTWATSGTQPSVGNGTLTGKWARVGNTVFARVTLLFGSTTTVGTGTWSITAPVAGLAAASPAFPQYLGGSMIRDSSASAYFAASSYLDVTGNNLGICSASGIVSNTVPFTWANGDYAGINLAYEIATP